MHNIVVERPYRFIPPHRGTRWPGFIQWLNLYGHYLRKHEGIVGFELRDQQRLKESLDRGHGIMLAPNHCRTADPLVLGWLARNVGCHLYAMASWHLFNESRFKTWAIRRMGAFSVNRDGVDRQAINMAIEVLEKAERPLIVFPEGSVSRTNDKLHALLEGVAFIARAAAKRRAKHAGGQIVVHPVAIKYRFQGELEPAIDGVLTEIEQRLTWDPQRSLPVLQRVMKAGRALLCLKELEYFGDTQPGRLHDRLKGLIDRLLHPLEMEYFGEQKTGAAVPRTKALRSHLLPDMVQGRLEHQEYQRRWRQLSQLYLAQQVSCYPPDYLAYPSVDRILETVERYEEDLTGKARVHGSLRAIIQVGEAIEVGPERERSPQGDPLMTRLERELQGMLDVLSKESPLFVSPATAEAAAEAV